MTTPIVKYPVTNVPPIIYTLPSTARVQSSNDKSSAQFHGAANSTSPLFSLFGSSRSEPEKATFVPINHSEFVTVPYEGADSNDLSKIAESSRFYTPKPIGPQLLKKPEQVAGTPSKPKPITKDTDDYIFQFYIGSLSVVGLLMLFRMMQKS